MRPESPKTGLAAGGAYIVPMTCPFLLIRMGFAFCFFFFTLLFLFLFILSLISVYILSIYLIVRTRSA